MTSAADLKHPVPFEIIEGDGMRVASNGQLRLTVMGEGGSIVRRRAITGIQTKPAAEMLIPLLNGLATELLAQPDMPSQDAVARLLALAGMVPVAEPRRIEWAMAELNGVRVYTDGVNVVMTTEDLKP
jgi:hypothetical protein